MNASPLRLLSSSEADTRAIGRVLAAHLAVGDVVYLVGELGAGKTRLAKGIAEGLGIDPDEVTSPTYTLIAEHAGRLPLAHVDLYRLEDPDQLEDTGVDELLGGRCVAVVEWPDRFEDVLAPPTARVEIEPGEADTDRVLSVEWTSPAASGLIAALDPWHKS